MSQENHNPIVTHGSRRVLAKMPIPRIPFKHESESRRGQNVVIFSTRAELKGIMLSERSQAQTAEYHMTSYTASRGAELMELRIAWWLEEAWGSPGRLLSGYEGTVRQENEVWCCLCGIVWLPTPTARYTFHRGEGVWMFSPLTKNGFLRQMTCLPWYDYTVYT